ncbi:MAG: hypothetical protein ACOZQL_42370 [Myxococcota bacterium]
MNRLHLLPLVVFAGCATTSSFAFYPLEELRALDATADRAEILTHALEVAPSKRNDEWRGVVERAAMATLDTVEVTDAARADQALELLESQPARFPFLLRSAGWLSKRADVGVKAFPWLAHQGDRGAWQRRVLEFARADAVMKGLAQRMASEVLLKQLIASTAAPLYELAFTREGDAVCDSPTVKDIALEYGSDGSPWKVALEKCWKQLAGPMTEAAKKSETRTGRLNLCAAMASHADDPQVKAVCADAR